MADKTFVSTDYDQFTQTTTKTGGKVTLFKISETGQLRHHNITIMAGFRYGKEPNIEFTVIDIYLWAAEWFFSSHGTIQLVIDNENYKFEAHESSSEVDKMIPGNIDERTYYIISKEIVEKIAASQKLQIRFTGQAKSADADDKEINKFRILAQQFYNEVFDSSKFTDSLKQSHTSGCFIATAVMDSYDHPIVIDLRIFRDNWLLKRKWGVSFTNWYYTYGPNAARIIEKSKLLKQVTYYLIIRPLHFLASLLKS